MPLGLSIGPESAFCNCGVRGRVLRRDGSCVSGRCGCIHCNGRRRNGCGRHDCLLSPYGAPNDRLWVRETCHAEELPDGLYGVRYKADNTFQPIDPTQVSADRWLTLNHYRHGATGKRGLIVPSIHMPRWASRILLEVTDVRVERLQDCSEDDASAEGCPDDAAWALDWHRLLWDSLNADRGYGWAENPWIWVVSFKRVQS